MKFESIFFDYWNENKYEKGFGQITFYDKYYEKIDVINIDTTKYQFHGIYLCMKNSSDVKKVFYEEHEQ